MKSRIIFLGTGSATHLTRQMTAIVFVFGKHHVLVDCGDGMGTIRNINKSDISLKNINDVLLTHRHADHVSGISHFLFLKMLQGAKNKVRVFGPFQTLTLAKKFSFETHDFTQKNSHRIAFIGVNPKQDFTLHQSINIKAIRVPGGDSKSKTVCFGYSFLYHKKKIVFSSDMKPSTGFEKFAQNSDILIHDCFGIYRDHKYINSVGHSTAKQAAETAEHANAKRLILTHLPRIDKTTETEILNEARKYFRGEVIVAEDLMEIEV